MSFPEACETSRTCCFRTENASPSTDAASTENRRASALCASTLSVPMTSNVANVTRNRTLKKDALARLFWRTRSHSFDFLAGVFFKSLENRFPLRNPQQHLSGPFARDASPWSAPSFQPDEVDSVEPSGAVMATRRSQCRGKMCDVLR